MNCNFNYITHKREWEFSPHQSYGYLGWFQHGLKTVALVVAILSWAAFLDRDRKQTTDFAYTLPRIIEIVMFSLLLFFYLIGAVLRYISSEVFAFAYHIVHIISHVVLLLSLIYQYDPSTYIFIYTLLLLLGELIQVLFLFLRSDDALVDIYDLPINAVWTYSSIVVVSYVIVLIFQVMISTSTYQQWHGQ